MRNIKLPAFVHTLISNAFASLSLNRKKNKKSCVCVAAFFFLFTFFQFFIWEKCHVFLIRNLDAGGVLSNKMDPK